MASDAIPRWELSLYYMVVSEMVSRDGKEGQHVMVAHAPQASQLSLNKQQTQRLAHAVGEEEITRSILTRI